jgi:hypothetical protein
MSALFQFGHHFLANTQNSRSNVLNLGWGFLALRTASCWRKAKTSRIRSRRERKRQKMAARSSLSKKSIGQNHSSPVPCPRLQVIEYNASINFGEGHVPWYVRLFGAPTGHTEDDLDMHHTNDGFAEHEYFDIPITLAQANAMTAAMADRESDPGRYNLIFNNCAGFVEAVLHSGGVSNVPYREIFLPRVVKPILWDNNGGH